MSDTLEEMREYECEFYKVLAPAKSCLFCDYCTDVFWDFSNGPYAFLCTADSMLVWNCDATYGKCQKFKEDE